MNLSLEQCLYLAEQNSYQLQADESKIAVAENAASFAKTNTLPKIKGEIATENRFLNPYQYNQSWASVYADWSLGDFLKKTDRTALQNIEIRKIVKEQNQLDLSGRISALYMSIIQTQKQIEILDLRIVFLKHHYEITKSLWLAGVRNRLDVLQTETKIAEEQEILSNLVFQKGNHKIELSSLIGMTTSIAFQLIPIDIDRIATIPAPEINSESISNNPLLILYDSKIQSERYRTEEINAEQLPHIQLGTSYTTDGDPTGDGNFLGISAGLTIPIYYGKELKYKRQLIENTIQSLEAQKQQAEQELTIKLVKAQQKLIHIKTILSIQQQKTDLAQTTANIAESNYKAGISTNLEFLEAQQILTNSELTSQETLLNYTMGLIDFYMLTSQIQNIISFGQIQD
jgi:outer membrane protein TolC